LAENGDISNGKRGRYHIQRREQVKKEIHRLITTEGLTNNQLCERLNIPRRTLERYLHEIFNEDNDLLIRPTAQDIAMHITLFKEQLVVQRQQILKEIANNPDVKDVNAKIAAHNLAADMFWAATKLSINTPAFIIRHTKWMEENNKNNKTFRAIVEQKDLLDVPIHLNNPVQ
jgi:predicted transcriptional regulator